MSFLIVSPIIPVWQKLEIKNTSFLNFFSRFTQIILKTLSKSQYQERNTVNDLGINSAYIHTHTNTSMALFLSLYIYAYSYD